MTVREFIKYLETQPQDIQVAYKFCSEQCLLKTKDIVIKELKLPREDGWIHDTWRGQENEPHQPYLLLPGN